MTRSQRLRSAEWFAREGKYGFIPPSWMKSQGIERCLFIDHVRQADQGVDFDVLVGGSGKPESKVSF